MGNYLFDRRKQLGLTMKEVAQRVGVSEGTISRWENGQIANMRRDRINDYARALKTTPSFIMTGELPAQSQPAVPIGFEPLPQMAEVPLIGDIACGTPILAEENIKARVGVPAAWRANFALTCHGDSMAPKIVDGDVVCIRTQCEVENGEIAAVRIGEEATLKRFYQLAPDTVQLIAINADVCPPMVYLGEQLNDIQIEGLAVGICRGI